MGYVLSILGVASGLVTLFMGVMGYNQKVADVGTGLLIAGLAGLGTLGLKDGLGWTFRDLTVSGDTLVFVAIAGGLAACVVVLFKK